MAVDPLAIAGAAGSVLSSVFGDKGMSGNVQKHLARESLNKQGAPLAQQLSTKLAELPLSDRAAYLLSQRLAAPQGQFQAHDIYNPGASAAAPSYATGPDLNAANAAYKPGMGCFDPGVLKQALANLGSSSDQSYSTSAGGSTPWGADAFAPIPTEKDVSVAKQKASLAKQKAWLQNIFGK